MKAAAGATISVIGNITSLQESDIPALILGERLGLGAAYCGKNSLIIEAILDANVKHSIVAVGRVSPFQTLNLQCIERLTDYKGRIG